MKDNSGKILLALLAGASAGVIAGLLMAPDTGEATRDTLKKTASKIGKDLESRLQPLVDKLGDLNAGAILSTLTGNDQGGSNTSGNSGSGSTSGSGSNYTSGTSGSSGGGTSGAGGTGTGTAGTGGVTGSRVGGTTTSGGTATSGGGSGAGRVS